MGRSIAIVYNEPVPDNYYRDEEAAVIGVLDAVSAVHQALLKLDYSVVRVPLLPPPENSRKQLNRLEADLIFNLFEGFSGQPDSEAEIANILSATGIPYTGCTGSTLRLCIDKAKTKSILRAGKIDTPDFQIWNNRTLSQFRIGFPCIVKPRCEDASHGLKPENVVYNSASLKKQAANICKYYGGQALIEKFIDGREFNATILGNVDCNVLPISEIVYTLPEGMSNMLTFDSKWAPDSLYYQNTKVICPARIEPKNQEYIAGAAMKAYVLLGCRGYARVDMRLDDEGRVNVIEVNPNPDISPGSGSVRQAEAAGMSYTQFIDRIVTLASG